MEELKFAKLTIQDKVACFSLNRPERANAIDAELWKEIGEFFLWANDQTHIRAVVLCGEGKNFCAGIDFSLIEHLSKKFESLAEGLRQDELRSTIMRLQSYFTAIEVNRKPVIAAVHGACYGAGVDLITACDIRLASNSARFSVKEVDLAIVADVGTLQRLPRLVGEGRARELAFTAREFGSQEAAQIGLVEGVYEEGQLLEEAMKMATTIAQKSPMAVRGTKHVLNYSRDHSVAQGLEYVANWNAAMLFSKDFKQAIGSIMSKKPAVYEDS